MISFVYQPFLVFFGIIKLDHILQKGVPMSNYLSVSSLTKYLKLKFDKDPYLERVYLTGQVSNFRKRPNHQYFSLKDEKAVIQATVWAGVYKSFGFELEEGMKINVIGRIQLYEPSGSYSIVIEKAEPDGVGALAIQFEQLKKKLQEEGLFQEKFKQAIPQFSHKIGVITSQSGAVIRDIITTVTRRFPGVEILLFPTKVQGEGAAQEIVANIQKANARTDLDVLIIGRGGGSIEDLWAFNEEPVVRAIFESSTLADFVADRRAATPTAAAELATPVTKLDLLNHLQKQEGRMATAMRNRLVYNRERLQKLSQSVIFRQPERLYDSYLQKLDQIQLRLKQAVSESVTRNSRQLQEVRHRLASQAPQHQLERYRDQILQMERLMTLKIKELYQTKAADAKRLSEALLMLDTSRIVARGYALVQAGNQVLDSVDTIKEKDALTLVMRDGQVEVEVKHVERKEI